MDTGVECFSCRTPNAMHMFGPNIYCSVCIKTFIAMEEYMIAEINKFKKLNESESNK
jgi:hypothetical protein